MSKSPSRCMVRLKEKLKLAEIKKNIHLFVSYYIFQYYNVLVIGRFQWLIQSEREARGTFLLTCLQNVCFWNFDRPRSLGDMKKRFSVQVTRHARHCFLVHVVAESSRTANRACRTSSGSDTCSGGNSSSFPLSSVPDERKKRPRTAFTPAQIKSLEAEFEKNKYLSVAKRLQLSKSLKLTETQVCRCMMYGAVCSVSSYVTWHTGQSEVMSHISY